MVRRCRAGCPAPVELPSAAGAVDIDGLAGDIQSRTGPHLEVFIERHAADAAGDLRFSLKPHKVFLFDRETEARVNFEVK